MQEATRRELAPADVRTALRVAVVPSPSGAFTVTLLGEGQHAPNDAIEALLVPLSGSVDLRNLG
jgi:hypothetical protein